MSTIRILGSGTSTGVPQIGCVCPTCTSTDPRDKRLRTSALISINDHNILIDCGPDFRTQILDAGSPKIDALLLTHIHYDHVGGLDDLRPYCLNGPFPIYCRDDVARDIRAHMPYSFADPPYPGSPTFDMHIINDQEPFLITPGNIRIIPLPLMHANFPILGFRIDNMAYITDCKTMPYTTKQLLYGLDLLIINALRPETHPSHLSLSETIAIVNEVKPRCTILTHIAHQMGLHAQRSKLLPPGILLASDGMTLSF